MTRQRGKAGRTVLGVLAAAVVVLVGSATLASGAVGEPWLLGRNNTSSATTALNWDTGRAPIPTDVGLAVKGYPNGAVFTMNEELVSDLEGAIVGIQGYGNDWGGYFYGHNSGVVAESYTGPTVDASASEGTAVVATGDVGVEATGQVGVQATGDVGVEATGTDTGLTATGPVALRTEGAVSFSSAGLVVLPKGATSATVRPGTDVTAATMVLATAQTAGGQVKRVTRNATANTVTIVLTAAATQPVTVAYFVIQ